MNTSHSAKTLALFTVTVLAMLAVMMGAALLGSGGQAQATEIVKLERVVIVGKRAEPSTVIAQLPRVVITGRSAAHGDVQLAAAKLVKVI